MFDDGLRYEIITGRTEGRAIIDQVYNDNRFSGNIEDRVDENGNLTFTLPSTDTRVTTIPELSGTGCMYGFAYQYMFLGTDLESDLDGLDIKYDEYDNKLKAEASFRLGVQYVLGQYFVRLRLTPTS